jgi:hypothetical protein
VNTKSLGKQIGDRLKELGVPKFSTGQFWTFPLADEFLNREAVLLVVDSPCGSRRMMLLVALRKKQ